MSKTSDNLVTHIVSFRVTEAEKETLEEMASAFDGNMSILLRKYLHLLEEENFVGFRGRSRAKNLAC